MKTDAVDKGSLKRQIPRFLVAGSSAVACDSLLYFALASFLSHSPAKIVSFLSGTVVAYVVNKYWTFEKRKKSHREIAFFLCLYLITLGVNVGVNKMGLLVTGDVFMSFLIATGTSTVLNFIGQKWIVFR